MKRTLTLLLMIALLLSGCGRPTGPAVPSSPLSEQQVQDLLRQYVKDPAAGIASGLTAGAESLLLNTGGKPGEWVPPSKPPFYMIDLSAKEWQVRLVAWTDSELFAVLSFQNLITKKPDEMKWHLALVDGRWRVEDHGLIPGVWKSSLKGSARDMGRHMNRGWMD